MTENRAFFQAMRKSIIKNTSYPLFPGLDEEKESQTRRSIARERLPTNTTTHNHSIHRWYSFIAGFSPEFVNECFEEAMLGSTSVVLDPFAGCGTTLVVASSRRIRSIGFEPHPFFARIARAKQSSATTMEHIGKVQNTIEEGFRNPVPVSSLRDAPARFLAKLFPGEVLASLMGAREALRERNLDDDLAFLILSKILDKCSHSQTDGIYKAPTSRKGASTPRSAADEVIQLVRTDLRTSLNPPKGTAQVHERSSENMAPVPSGSISLIVTSPPYLNNFDYAEMTRMYLYFWGMADSWGDITEKVRGRLVVNTTTALKGHRHRRDEYREKIGARLRPELDRLVGELAERKKVKPGKKEYDQLVYPYFKQMGGILEECHRVLRPHAPLHMMVADAALYGIHISSPQFLQTTLEDIGFNNVSCTLVRRRGHRWVLDKREGSAVGLGEYHIRAEK